MRNPVGFLSHQWTGCIGQRLRMHDRRRARAGERTRYPRQFLLHTGGPPWALQHADGAGRGGVFRSVALGGSGYRASLLLGGSGMASTGLEHGNKSQI